jgi:hypothetical protein
MSIPMLIWNCHGDNVVASNLYNVNFIFFENRKNWIRKQTLCIINF